LPEGWCWGVAFEGDWKISYVRYDGI